ncbi:MAG TPA: heavy metal-associated domain-containing protein [Bacilli bacterium]|nr:heavy metal-associated domain-containing protein [Bacilli bacterium]
MTERRFVVQGMNTTEDAVYVDSILSQMPGVQGLSIQQDTAEVRLSYDENAASYEQIKQAVLDKGYGVLNVGGDGR